MDQVRSDGTMPRQSLRESRAITSLQYLSTLLIM